MFELIKRNFQRFQLPKKIPTLLHKKSVKKSDDTTFAFI